MNMNFLYKDNKIVVEDENGNITGPYMYSENLEEKLKLENDIEEKNEVLNKYANFSSYLKDEINKEDKYSKSFLYAGIGASLINYLLSFTYDLKDIYISSNFDVNNLRIGNVLFDCNSYIGIKGALIILPIPIFLSIFHYAMKKMTQEELESLKNIITDTKLDIGSLYDKIYKLDNKNNKVSNKYEDYDLVDLVTGEVTNVSEKLLKK